MKTITLLIFASLLATSCGSKEDTNDETIPGSLLGVWTNFCENEFNDGVLTSNKTVLTITETDFKVETRLYNNHFCAESNLYGGTIENHTYILEGLTSALITYTSVYTYFTDQEYIDYCNTEAVCNQTDWVINSPQEITGEVCLGVQINNVGDSTIANFQLNDSILQIGMLGILYKQIGDE